MTGIIIGCVIVIIIFIIIFIVINNKFKFARIKLDKAEEDINLYLNRKRELLDRTRPVIKKELHLDDYLEILEEYNEKSGNFYNHNILKTSYNALFKTLDDNEKLLKSNTLNKLLDELNDNEEDVIGSIKFYNDTVVEYNRLVISFPSSIVAIVFRHKKLEFYNNEKREVFEILK